MCTITVLKDKSLFIYSAVKSGKQYMCLITLVILLLCGSMPKPAAGSAPSLPSYSYRISQAAQFTRSPASLPPVFHRQMSAPHSASPTARRCSPTGQSNRQPTRLSVGRIGRAPSTPAFCAVQPSPASSVVKVMHRYTSLFDCIFTTLGHTSASGARFSKNLRTNLGKT